MRRELKLSTAAVALLGAALWMSTPALADDEDGVFELGFGQTFLVEKQFFLFGEVDTNAEETQSVTFFDATANDKNTALIHNFVLQNATGNIGVNNAAGFGNVQDNVTALSDRLQDVTGASFVSGTLDVSAQVDQNASGTDHSAFIVNEAELEENVLQFASGNIGVNNAAGTGNLQSNALAAGTGGGSATGNEVQDVVARVDINQDFSGSWTDVGNTNEATLENNVLSNASGNIGVNNAAGDGNIQANAAALAKADDGRGFAFGSISQGSDVDVSGSAPINEATIEDNVLRFATGNAGVNNAAGDFNRQANGLAIAVAEVDIENVTASVSQSLHIVNSLSGVTNNAFIQGNVAQNFKGNIGINNAAGVANTQANLLVIGHQIVE